MRLLPRKKVGEHKAAGAFIFAMLERAHQAWPCIVKELEPLLGETAAELTEEWASFEFALATMACESQAVHNLLPADQAQRVDEWVLHCMMAHDETTAAGFQAYR